MKKNYVKPELDVVAFSSENLLQGSTIPGGDQGVIPMTNKHQGGWDQKQWTEN